MKRPRSLRRLRAFRFPWRLRILRRRRERTIRALLSLRQQRAAQTRHLWNAYRRIEQLRVELAQERGMRYDSPMGRRLAAFEAAREQLTMEEGEGARLILLNAHRNT
jgi:hypothetical protein